MKNKPNAMSLQDLLHSVEVPGLKKLHKLFQQKEDSVPDSPRTPVIDIKLTWSKHIRSTISMLLKYDSLLNAEGVDLPNIENFQLSDTVMYDCATIALYRSLGLPDNILDCTKEQLFTALDQIFGTLEAADIVLGNTSKVTMLLASVLCQCGTGRNNKNIVMFDPGSEYIERYSSTYIRALVDSRNTPLCLDPKEPRDGILVNRGIPEMPVYWDAVTSLSDCCDMTFGLREGDTTTLVQSFLNLAWHLGVDAMVESPAFPVQKRLSAKDQIGLHAAAVTHAMIPQHLSKYGSRCKIQHTAVVLTQLDNECAGASILTPVGLYDPSHKFIYSSCAYGRILLNRQYLGINESILREALGSAFFMFDPDYVYQHTIDQITDTSMYVPMEQLVEKTPLLFIEKCKDYPGIQRWFFEVTIPSFAIKDVLDTKLSTGVTVAGGLSIHIENRGIDYMTHETLPVLLPALYNLASSVNKEASTEKAQLRMLAEHSSLVTLLTTPQKRVTLGNAGGTKSCDILLGAIIELINTEGDQRRNPDIQVLLDLTDTLLRYLPIYRVLHCLFPAYTGYDQLNRVDHLGAKVTHWQDSGVPMPKDNKLYQINCLIYIVVRSLSISTPYFSFGSMHNIRKIIASLITALVYLGNIGTSAYHEKLENQAPIYPGDKKSLAVLRSNKMRNTIIACTLGIKDGNTEFLLEKALQLVGKLQF